MSLHSKMVLAAGKIGNIPKNGWNDFHKYHYVREEDVVEAVRSALAEQNIALYVSSKIVEMREWQTPKGKPTLITNVQVEMTFADSDTGETFTITSAGSGDDSSDKGAPKAITGAVKYALMKTFLIATGDDPEDSRPAREQDVVEQVEWWTDEQKRQLVREQNRMTAAFGVESAEAEYNKALVVVGIAVGEPMTREQAAQLLTLLAAVDAAVPA